MATSRQQAATRPAGAKGQQHKTAARAGGANVPVTPAMKPDEDLTLDTTEAFLADAYLSDRVYDALLEIGEAAKISEITLEINNPRIAYPVVRRILTDSPRFLSVDRLWTLSARYLDTSRPTDRNLQEVLEAAGKPLSVVEIATELSAVYNRPSDVYLQLLRQTLRGGPRYFRTADDRFGLTSWLPLVDAEEPADVLYDNRMTRPLLAPFLQANTGVKWTTAAYADATYTVAGALNERPLPHRVAGVLAWASLRDGYDPLKHLLACLKDPRLVWLSGRTGGRWITREHAARLEALLEERSAAMAGEETEETAVAAPVPVAPEPEHVAAPAATVATEAPAAETTEAEPEPAPAAAQPLVVSDEDLQAIGRIVDERGAPIEVSELLALQYEVVPGDASFKSDVETLESRLRADARFHYVGAGRFREPNSLPLFVYSIPEFLAFPDLQFVSLDGEIMDEEIEDEGFVGTLRHDILNPLAQDVGDDEGRYTGPESADPNSIRLVLKAHHKEIGTFPLCQVPDGFFPEDAQVVEVAVRDPNGNTHDVIVNNEQRLAFNLFGLYEFLPSDSGAAFVLQRGPRPFEYRFEPAEENDAEVVIAPARMSELLALREQAEEGGDMATFDITCEVLAHYPKGLDFVQLLTEVNIVRRVTRRKLASILSNYYCFVQKAGQSLWRFDPKKRDLGTDRAKRKYLKR